MIATACAALVLAPTLPAATLNILNPSFEFDILGNGGIGYTVANWTPNVSCCAVGIQDPTTGNYLSGTSIDGDNFAYGNGGGYGYYQVLSNTFQRNMVYTFSMMVGHRLDLGFGGYKLELRAGNVFNAVTPVATLTGAVDPGAGNWGSRTLTYTTGAAGPEIGQNILISFGSNGIQTNFDLATGTVDPVPEPATLGLIGASLIGFSLSRFSRRAASH